MAPNDNVKPIQNTHVFSYIHSHGIVVHVMHRYDEIS